MAGCRIQRWVGRVGSASLCGAVLVTFWWSRQMLRTTESAHGATMRVLTAETRQAEQVHLLQRQQQALVRRASLIDALTERMPASTVLREVSTALPAGVGLERLRLRTRRVDRSDDTRLAYDIALELTGRAGSAPEASAFLSRLRTNPFFSDHGGWRILPSDAVRFECDVAVRTNTGRAGA